MLHATYDGDGFRFYSYAGTFFEFLWRDYPAKLQEMYRYLRADDPAAFDSWRNRMGSDAGLQQQYDAFLDAQIAIVDDLFVPNTAFTPNGSLKFATPAEVQSAFAAATANTPTCKDDGDPGIGRVHLHRPDHRQPRQLRQPRPGLQGHGRDRRLLHPRPHQARREQLHRYELLLRADRHLVLGQGRHRGLPLRGSAATVTPPPRPMASCTGGPCPPGTVSSR